MASGTFRNPLLTSSPLRSPNENGPGTHHARTRSGSDSRPPSRASYHSTTDEQISHEFDHVKELLSLSGPQAGLGGLAQHAFPRQFRASISHSQVLKELDILRNSVLQRIDEGGISELEDDHVDEDPAAHADQSSLEALHKSQEQIARLEDLLKEHESSLGHARRHVKDMETILESKDRERRDLISKSDEQKKYIFQSHETALKSREQALEELRKNHQEDLEDTRARLTSKLTSKDAEAQNVIERHKNQIEEQGKNFSESLAAKESDAQSMQCRFEQQKRELEKKHHENLQSAREVHERDAADREGNHSQLREKLESEISDLKVRIDELSRKLAENTNGAAASKEEIDALKGKHEQLMGERDDEVRNQLSSKDREIDNLKREHEEAFRSTTKKHASEIESLEKEHGDQSRRLEGEHGNKLKLWEDSVLKDLAGVRANHEIQIQELRNAHAAERALSDERQKQTLQDQERRWQDKINEMQASHERALTALEKSKSDAVDLEKRTREAQLEVRLDDARQSYEVSRRELEVAKAAALEMVREEHDKSSQEQTRSLRKSHENDLAEKVASNEAALEKAQNAHAAGLNKFQGNCSEHEREIRERESSHQSSLRDLIYTHEAELNRFRQQESDHAKELQQREASHQSSLDDTRRVHAAEMQDLHQSYLNRMTELKTSHESSYAELNRKGDDKVTRLHSELAEMDKAHEGKLFALGKSKDDEMLELRRRHEVQVNEMRSEALQSQAAGEALQKQLQGAEEASLQQCQALKQKITEAEDQSDAAVKAAMQDHERRISRLKDEMEIAIAQTEAQIVEQKDVNALQLQDQAEQFDAKMKSVAEEFKNQHMTRDQLHQDEVNKLLEKHENDKRSLEEANDVRVSDLRRTHEAVMLDADRSRNIAVKHREKIVRDSVISELEQLFRVDVEKAKSELAAKLAHYGTDGARKNDVAVSQRDQKIRELTSRIDQYHREIKAIKERHATTEKTADAIGDDARIAQVQNLQKSLETAINARSKLKQQLASKSSQLQSAQHDLREASHGRLEAEKRAECLTNDMDALKKQFEGARRLRQEAESAKEASLDELSSVRRKLHEVIEKKHQAERVRDAMLVRSSSLPQEKKTPRQSMEEDLTSRYVQELASAKAELVEQFNKSIKRLSVNQPSAFTEPAKLWTRDSRARDSRPETRSSAESRRKVVTPVRQELRDQVNGYDERVTALLSSGAAMSMTNDLSIQPDKFEQLARDYSRKSMDLPEYPPRTPQKPERRDSAVGTPMTDINQPGESPQSAKRNSNRNPGSDWGTPKVKDFAVTPETSKDSALTDSPGSGAEPGRAVNVNHLIRLRKNSSERKAERFGGALNMHQGSGGSGKQSQEQRRDTPGPAAKSEEKHAPKREPNGVAAQESKSAMPDAGPAGHGKGEVNGFMKKTPQSSPKAEAGSASHKGRSLAERQSSAMNMFKRR